MHFKWRYKICICSVILFKIESFRNYKVFSIIFPKILDDVLQKYEFSGFFSPSHFLIQKFNFSFPFILQKIAYPG